MGVTLMVHRRRSVVKRREDESRDEEKREPEQIGKEEICFWSTRLFCQTGHEKKVCVPLVELLMELKKKNSFHW